MNIINWLIEKKNSDSYAIVSGDVHITYAQLYEYSMSLSKRLENVEIQNVGLYAKSTYKYIIGYFAILLAGKCVVPFKLSGSAGDRKSIIKKTNIKYVLVDSTIEVDDINEIIIKECSLKGDEIYSLREENDDVVLLETTGTTGDKKLVRLSEKNLQYVVKSYCDIRKFELNQAINYLILMPLQSAYGNFVFLACIYTGATIYLKDDFMPWDFRNMVVDNNITHIECISSLLTALCKLYTKGEWKHLIYLGYGGEKIYESDIKRVIKLFPGVQICQGYGLTEAGPMVSYIPPELSIENIDKFFEKIDSVGIPLKGLDVKIVSDDEHGKGEILIAGPNIMKGYYGDDSEDVFCGKYLRTGDIGYVDDEGFIFVTGRRKNIVIVQGMNVQVETVEEVIRNYELIDDVKVYGKKDPFLGERLCADIVPLSNIDINNIKKFMMNKVDIHKIPTEINIVKNIERIDNKIKR